MYQLALTIIFYGNVKGLKKKMYVTNHVNVITSELNKRLVSSSAAADHAVINSSP